MNHVIIKKLRCMLHPMKGFIREPTKIFDRKNVPPINKKNELHKQVR